MTVFLQHLSTKVLHLNLPLLMSATQFSYKLETLKSNWLLYESIPYSTTVFWNICLEKADFAHFVSRPLGEKLVKHLFWQKWWILKTLKLQKLKNTSRLLGERLPKKTSFDKTGDFWKLWSKNLKILNLFILYVSRFDEKLP